MKRILTVGILILTLTAPIVASADAMYLSVVDVAAEYFGSIPVSAGTGELKLVSKDNNCAVIVTVNAVDNVTFTVQDYNKFVQQKVTFRKFVQSYNNQIDSDRGYIINYYLNYAYNANSFSINEGSSTEPYNNDPHEDRTEIMNDTQVAFTGTKNDFTMSINLYESGRISSIACKITK